MSNLLASISHELRTPLSGIMTQLECSLESKLIPESIKEKHLIPSHSCARLLLYFVNDLVDYVDEKAESFMKLDLK